MIKCVCGVYRAHLLQSVKDHHIISSQPKFKEYEVFNDNYHEQNRSDILPIPPSSTYGRRSAHSRIIESDNVPSLDKITHYYRYIFNKAQMESDCIIMSLVYIERVLRETNGGVRPTIKNWRSLLFSSMVMSSKVWDDLSMWNADFSRTSPSGIKFSLKRVNELEVGLLTCLKYNVKVHASEYAKYYFLLRSMIIRSGLSESKEAISQPLDIEGAKKLQFVSSNYNILPKPKMISSKSKSTGEIENGSTTTPRSSVSNQIKLEQLVNMQ